MQSERPHYAQFGVMQARKFMTMGTEKEGQRGSSQTSLRGNMGRAHA